MNNKKITRESFIMESAILARDFIEKSSKVYNSINLVSERYIVCKYMNKVITSSSEEREQKIDILSSSNINDYIIYDIISRKTIRIDLNFKDRTTAEFPIYTTIQHITKDHIVCGNMILSLDKIIKIYTDNGISIDQSTRTQNIRENYGYNIIDNPTICAYLPNYIIKDVGMLQEHLIDGADNIIYLYTLRDAANIIVHLKEDNYKEQIITKLKKEELFTYSIYYIDINGYIRSAIKKTYENIVSVQKFSNINNIVNIWWSNYLNAFVYITYEQLHYSLYIANVRINESINNTNLHMYNFEKIESVEITKIYPTERYLNNIKTCPNSIIELDKIGRICIIRMRETVSFRIFLDLKDYKPNLSKYYTWQYHQRTKKTHNFGIISRIEFRLVKWYHRPTVLPYLLYDQKNTLDLSPTGEKYILKDMLASLLEEYLGNSYYITDIMGKYI